MPDILLSTLNARYAHTAFGLRYLLANLGELRSRAAICEFEINQRPLDIVEALLRQEPKIIGLGVYVWNVALATAVTADLKRLRPDVVVVLGGPEVSYETERQEIAQLADYVITGEADLAFADLCRRVLGGQRPPAEIIQAPLPEFPQLALPYDLYDEHDLAHRVVYVEASRGCPFGCEFCLSSLGVPVRSAPLDTFLAAMQRLLDRGLRRFKFVDRTFNLNISTSRAILQFFLDRYQPDLFLHFEMIPDRLPEPLRELIRQFPAGSLQLEVGIQTFNPEVAERINRRQDNARAEENLRFLQEQTKVHVHADLIVGLPGEDIQSFATGFDRLVGLAPQEIQVGILKRLRGAPIARHDAEWAMIYSPNPPYEVLQTRLISFATMQRMRRFARYWDLVANSGNFLATVPLIWERESAFSAFLAFSDWLYSQGRRTHGIALQHLTESLFRYLTGQIGRDRVTVGMALAQDYERAGRRDLPDLVRAAAGALPVCDHSIPIGSSPPRQRRHNSR